MKKVLLILLIIVFLVSCSNANNTFTISEDQQKLIDEFGQPSNFMITMESDRYEVWHYNSLGKSFTFYNGNFMGSSYIVELDEKFSFPDFTPMDFQYISFDELKQEIGEPTASGELQLKVLGTTSIDIYDYYDQLKVGVKNNQVVFVQTLPVYVGEDSNITETSSGSNKEITKLYQDYVNAYNDYIDLVSQGLADTDEGAEAYNLYLEAEENYNTAKNE